MAHHEDTAEAHGALHGAFLELAGVVKVTSPPDLPTVATRYVLDAADATRRQLVIAENHRDPVLCVPPVRSLATAEHDVLTARNRCRAL
jgi:hypothetical protein